MKKLTYCYHTHTKRCGHALGEDEEYVLKAIALGIKRLGFSDHVFLPNVDSPWMRGSFDLLDEYVNSIRNLKEKYKDKIEISVGFEAEFFPSFIPYYKELLSSKKIDYLIIGQHLHEEDGKIAPYFKRDAMETEMVTLYVDDLIKGIETGLFKYVCHPDIFINYYELWSDELISAARRLLECCEKHHIPIEVNVGGMRHKEYYSLNHYPSDTFFLLAKEYNIDIVIGIDAHRPDDFNIDDVNRALNFVKSHKLNIVDYKMKKD